MACKKCGSTNVVKNGRTATGQQKYHCRACGVYTVTGERAQHRAAQMEMVEKLLREQVSQREIARRPLATQEACGHTLTAGCCSACAMRTSA